MMLQSTAWSGFRRIILAAAVATLFASPAGAQPGKAAAQRQWESLSAQVSKAYQAGDYAKGIPLAEQALRLARQTFGDRDPKTLTSLNSLADLYKFQSRYTEAESLYREALQASRETFGPRHPQTLMSLSGLAFVYHFEGRYDEAEPLLREALQAAREIFGPRHSITLTSLASLGFLYAHQGRYDEAEPFFLEALQLRREAFGLHHPDTLSDLENLASLYSGQGRYDEAEQRYREVLQLSRKALGPYHAQTRSRLRGLALVYEAQGRYGEAEPLFREALQADRMSFGPHNPNILTSLFGLAEVYGFQGRYDDAVSLLEEAVQLSRKDVGDHEIRTMQLQVALATIFFLQGRYSEAEPIFEEALRTTRKVYGSSHPETLNSVGALSQLYKAQGRYAEAEPLAEESLQGYRQLLGARHPNTLTTISSLGDLRQAQGRYDEADRLYREALDTSRELLGPRHPQTLTLYYNLATLLVNLGQKEEAVGMLQQMESHLLNWIGQELYSTEAGAVRRNMVSSQAAFQDSVLTLATREDSTASRRLAGNVILRFKLLQSEEETYLARMARRSQDPRVRALAEELAKLRSALAAVARAEPAALEKTLQLLEAKQLALGAVNRDYKDHLRVMTANVEDVQAALPAGAILIEFRQFQLVDFRTGLSGEPRFAGLLLHGSDGPVTADLGPVSEVRQPTTALTDEAAATLYRQLFAPFEQKLAAATTVYVAPDGNLNLVPFARLKLADGRYWAERQEVRLLQSGRDLLRADPDKPARGLLALGGIDFGATAMAGKTKPSSPALVSAVSDRSRAVTRAAETLGNGFVRLAASGEEAMQVKEWYSRLRKDEPAELWSGIGASKARLMAMKSPPRVLHLATHGFYLAVEAREPMLQSGVALAGANHELAGRNAEGILFALEAQGLNLEGTDLVVLSACDTAHGNLDYSEGVYGLVRALRIAGARNVLVTLWKLNDGEARDFMVAFYKNWLTQARSDPARALRETQLFYLRQDKLRDPRVWAPYILIE
jgi:CHAT domain-containing protein/Tfp pilus assembly protein PilF